MALTLADAQLIAAAMNDVMGFSREIEADELVAALAERFPEIEWDLRPWNEVNEFNDVQVREKHDLQKSD